MTSGLLACDHERSGGRLRDAADSTSHARRATGPRATPRVRRRAAATAGKIVALRCRSLARRARRLALAAHLPRAGSSSCPHRALSLRSSLAAAPLAARAEPSRSPSASRHHALRIPKSVGASVDSCRLKRTLGVPVTIEPRVRCSTAGEYACSTGQKGVLSCASVGWRATVHVNADVSSPVAPSPSCTRAMNHARGMARAGRARCTPLQTASSRTTLPVRLLLPRGKSSCPPSPCFKSHVGASDSDVKECMSGNLCRVVVAYPGTSRHSDVLANREAETMHPSNILQASDIAEANCIVSGTTADARFIASAHDPRRL